MPLKLMAPTTRTHPYHATDALVTMTTLSLAMGLVSVCMITGYPSRTNSRSVYFGMVRQSKGPRSKGTIYHVKWIIYHISNTLFTPSYRAPRRPYLPCAVLKVAFLVQLSAVAAGFGILGVRTDQIYYTRGGVRVLENRDRSSLAN